MTSQRLIVVAGMHRSGTSAFARALEVFGISLQGRLRPSAEDNLKGFWEDQDIVDLNEALLAQLDRLSREVTE